MRFETKESDFRVQKLAEARIPSPMPDERFIDDQVANPLVDRARRKGFELPA